ncbi:MAG: efflux RND transporter periplasmic adaptor subunit [Candidatus Hydrogenedentes bacterium]|nr:efflux RND transporter periplasmic adaptor subunit [Candidatus Hydrogenedentota bacterium]
MKTSEEHTGKEVPKKRPSFLGKWLGRLFRLCIALAVIGGSGALSYRWITNPPVTHRRPRTPEAVLVKTLNIEIVRQQIIVRAMGTVIPETKIQLAARVNGQIIETAPNFIPGGRFIPGQKILQIDPKDYELVVKQQIGNLTRVQSEMRLEMGQQSVARSEYELLLDDIAEEDTDLLLRQPQLAIKQAAVEIAQAALEKAQLDLERTAIVAPFHAIVQERKVEQGSYVSPGTPLATLVGTDLFWVEVSIPVDELKWISFPDGSNVSGSTVRIYNSSAWGEGIYRVGCIKQLLPDLEAKGRIARVLATVSQPLAGEETKPSLLLDSFVRVEIEGAYLDNIAKVPRTALHNGNNLWFMLPNNTLEIREIDTIWGTNDGVYIESGVRDGERLVISDLASPMAGMELRTADMPHKNDRGAKGKGKGKGKTQ